MRMITISRQFGSGGRELGERLAKKLGWDYYDKNIIDKLCEKEHLDSEYVRRVFHENGWESASVPTSFGTFSTIGTAAAWKSSLMSKQCDVLREIAGLGRDCIIIGRDADIILAEHKPLRIFVDADMSFRLERCMKREEKKEGKKLNEKQMLRNIRKIDKIRRNTREMLSGKDVSDPENFDLVINSASWDMDMLVDHIAAMAENWSK